jgi:hypothetical protein
VTRERSEVPEAKGSKNRFHLDLLVGGARAVPREEPKARVIATAARLVAAGAVARNTTEAPDFDHFFIAMTDPEGNEFDVV